MIEVAGLTKRYGGVTAVDNISFTVKEGEVAGFVGLNGAGKSTTMRILCSFLPFESGEVKIGPHDVAKNSLGARSLIGYLPEGVPLYPDMRVVEFLRYRSSLKGLYGRRRLVAIDRVLADCGLEEVKSRIIGQISRGYRQRVGIADALLVDPPYLIMDEPTLGLDPIQVKQLRSLLKEIGRERTIIFSTHILSEVEVVCDSVIIIHQGKILSRGSNQEVKREAREKGRGEDDLDLEAAFVILVEEANKEEAKQLT